MRTINTGWDRTRDSTPAAGWAFSARGVRALRRGLKPLSQIASDMNVAESRLTKAPKAEWHHDLRTGKQIWFYDPARVWEWAQRKRIWPVRQSVNGIPADKVTGAAPTGNLGGSAAPALISATPIGEHNGHAPDAGAHFRTNTNSAT